VSDTDQANGQHTEHEDFGGMPQPLSVIDRKKRQAADNQELRAIFVSERDQLEAERSSLWERIKVLNAEVSNCDDIDGKLTKEIKAAGRQPTPTPPASTKRR
jgi:predicted  nucleic acid-binding Zn-ribbon protein